MPRHTILTNKMIESLAHLTYHNDREQLDKSLINNLNQLLAINQLLLYNVSHCSQKITCYLRAFTDENLETTIDTNFTQINCSSIQGFSQCLKSNMIFGYQREDGGLYLLFPITDRLNNIGQVLRVETVEKISEIDQEFLSSYLKTYQNYRNLLIDSESDTLTGLLNRRTFDRDLNKVLSEKSHSQDLVQKDNARNLPHRRRQKNNTHWLAIADIDHFKSINDNYGHLYGDEVLILLANIMRETFRNIDILFRFGGEEFVILLRYTDLSGAHNALERFRTKIERFDFPQVGKVTVSIGFVEITEQSIPTEILGYADEALYFSKDNGRNQLNQYEQLISEHNILEHHAPTNDIELF